MFEMWFLFAAAGTILYAAVTFVDKYIVEKVVDDYRGLVGISSIIALFVSISALPFVPSDIGIQSIAFLVLSGALIVISTFIYFYVVSSDHISFITIFFQIIPIFVIIFSYLLLGERLAIVQIVGAAIVFTAGIAMIAADQKTEGFGWTISRKSVILMVLYDVLWALAAICIRKVGADVTLNHLIVYESMGMGLVGLLIVFSLKAYRRALIKTLTKVPKIYLLVLVGNEGFLYLTAKLSMNYAYMLGLAGPVSVVESSQILAALVIGFILSSIWPKIFKENTDKHTMIKKLIYGLFMIFGLWFVR